MKKILFVTSAGNNQFNAIFSAVNGKQLEKVVKNLEAAFHQADEACAIDVVVDQSPEKLRDYLENGGYTDIVLTPTVLIETTFGEGSPVNITKLKQADLMTGDITSLFKQLH